MWWSTFQEKVFDYWQRILGKYEDLYPPHPNQTLILSPFLLLKVVLIGSISSTFYKQLLHAQIPNTQKRLMTLLSFLHFQGSVRVKAVEHWWNCHKGNVLPAGNMWPTNLCHVLSNRKLRLSLFWCKNISFLIGSLFWTYYRGSIYTRHVKIKTLFGPHIE